MFLGEDPAAVSKRIANAFYSRHQTALKLKYNFYIDSMPTDDPSKGLPRPTMDRIVEIATGNKKDFKRLIADGKADYLLAEMNLEHARTMNRLVFDQ
ncbi:hypothetical protein HDU91_002184, partial [Kappamyces sp. JEL0680]